MAKVRFQMIADNRFHKNIKKEIKNLTEKTIEVLQQNNVPHKVFTDDQVITFSDGTKQYRTTFVVDKERTFTYRQLYTWVNSVKPVPYDIIR